MVCGAQLLAKPTKRGKKLHDKLKTFAPKDHVGRWLYEIKGDRFLHKHHKMGLFKCEFVEDFDFEESNGRADDQGVARKD
jgi:hypothetical protein